MSRKYVPVCVATNIAFNIRDGSLAWLLTIVKSQKQNHFIKSMLAGNRTTLRVKSEVICSTISIKQAKSKI